MLCRVFSPFRVFFSFGSLHLTYEWLKLVSLLQVPLQHFTVNCKIRFQKWTTILLWSRKTSMFYASNIASDTLGWHLSFQWSDPLPSYFLIFTASSHPYCCQHSDSVPWFISLIPVHSATLISMNVTSGHTRSCWSPNVKFPPHLKAQLLLMLLKY